MSTHPALACCRRSKVTQQAHYHPSHCRALQEAQLTLVQLGSLACMTLKLHALEGRRHTQVSSLVLTCMKLGFLSHSPAEAQLAQLSCVSTHSPGSCSSRGGWGLFSHSGLKGLEWICSTAGLSALQCNAQDYTKRWHAVV